MVSVQGVAGESIRAATVKEPSTQLLLPPGVRGPLVYARGSDYTRTVKVRQRTAPASLSHRQGAGPKQAQKKLQKTLAFPFRADYY